MLEPEVPEVPEPEVLEPEVPEPEVPERAAQGAKPSREEGAQEPEQGQAVGLA